MSSFSINSHAHVDAAVFSIVLTFLTYGVKWVLGLKFPVLVFGVPSFIAVFLGFYLILFLVFLVLWNRG